ncbi:HAD family hydrolase [Streptomyces iconiensis]|uniref:HAD-IA family hydrolase n=1 Tax=Streptomyces iconiensis TaxID=1384038 RepID=A0ABT7A7H0_9ACTN|nr:HAD-IA family hydrolase [Streptomyces iconiensis]MDJ1137264.1 HAD-IA family hydrolase [Streptomyces iconiensis]
MKGPEERTRTAKAVMFDFSGTLLRVEPVERWLGHVLADARISLTPTEFELCAVRLRDAGALPGGPAPREVPPELRALWSTRDRSAREHRAAYLGLSRQVPLPRPELHEALYERHMLPEAWQPYPDTERVLAALHGRGIPVAVVSNIGWDLRPVFRAHGLDAYVTAYALSFEHGVQKPDPRLFRAACEAMDSDPRDTLMVGDDAHADAGARELGCAVHLVRHLPVDERPDGLLPVLAGAGCREDVPSDA